MYAVALNSQGATGQIVAFFAALKSAAQKGTEFPALGYIQEKLESLCDRHQQVDEHEVSLGGRVNQALSIADQANQRVEDYLAWKDLEATSGIELWEKIKDNQARIKKVLGMTPSDWDSFSGQLRFAINDVETL